jgi:hypothetical protein
MAFAVWLLGYLIWWIFFGVDNRNGPSESSRESSRQARSGSFTATYLWLIIGLFALPVGAMAECDCSHFPWKPSPPCSKTCGARVLNNSTEKDLLMLHIDAALARDIVAARHRNEIHSFSDLPPAQQEQIKLAFAVADPAVVQYLGSTPSDKVRLAAESNELRRRQDAMAREPLVQAQREQEQARHGRELVKAKKAAAKKAAAKPPAAKPPAAKPPAAKPPATKPPAAKPPAIDFGATT